MKAYRGKEVTLLRILDLITRWRWVIGSTVRLLYPRGNILVPTAHAPEDHK